MHRSALVICITAVMFTISCKSKEAPKDEAVKLTAQEGAKTSTDRPEPKVATTTTREQESDPINTEIVEGQEVGGEPVRLELGADEGIYDSEMQELGGSLTPGATTASSTLCEKGRRMCHYARRVVDSKAKTAWCEGAPGTGVDQWLEVDLGQARQIVGIRFEPFYAKDKARMFSNGRVKRMELQIGAASYDVHFADQDRGLVFKQGMQLDYQVPALTLLDHAALKAPVVTRRIRFVIKEVYPGDQHEDTCISSLDIYTKAPPKDAASGAGWLAGQWTVKVLDGSAGETVTSATMTFAGKGRFDFNATVQVPREDNPKQVRSEGSYQLEGEVLSLPDHDSGMTGCRPLKVALKARADSVTQGCRYLKQDPSTVLIWYASTGPVRRVLERWTRVK
jgi:hypothetical protein